MLWCKNEIAVYHTINGTVEVPPHPHNQPNTPNNRNHNNNNQRNRNTPNDNRNGNPRTPVVTPQPRPQPANIPRYNPPPCDDPRYTGNGNNDDINTPTNPPTPTPRPRNYDRQQVPPPSPFLDELTADLQRTSNPEAIFRYLHNTYPQCCPIHNDAPHPILDCYLLSRKCHECGVLPQLMEVKRSVGLLPPREQGGSTNRQYQRQTPPEPPYNNTTPPAPQARNQPLGPTQQPVTNPYRRQQHTPYVPYTPSNNNNNAPPQPNARRMTHDNTNPAYYNEHLNNFDTTNDSVIEIENNANSNNDLNVYFSTIIKSSQKSVTFAPDTKPPTPSNILSTSTYNPKSHKQLPTIKSLYRFVFDSGATNHMSPFKVMFESITYYDQHHENSPKVLMCDETTEIPIEGHGYINIIIHGKRIRTHALYIPRMGETCLYSIRQHMRYKGCIFHAESNNSSLSFPNFIIHPHITNEFDVLC
jgi:hypothetical protein